MKKTLLVAALLAGFAGAAQADTSVTLYGILDAGVSYQKVNGSYNGHSVSGTNIGEESGGQSGSRWGLKGAEDLGDGLQAVFDVESGFTTTDGRMGQTSRLFGRQATVGLLSNSWGELDFGRQSNLASKYIGNYVDPFGTSFGQANIGVGMSALNTYRIDNMILYQTPVFGGFQFGAGYSFNADSTNATTGTQYETNNRTREINLGGNYSNGPFYIAASYDQLNPGKGVTNYNTGDSETDATPREYGLGLTYDFQVVKLALAYSRTTDGWFGGQGGVATGNDGTLGGGFGSNEFAKGFKANSFLAGATLPIGGASSLFGSWQYVKASGDQLTGDDSNMNIWSVGYTYNLSKRTNLYASASYAKNYAFLDGVKSTVVQAGIRHRF